LFASILGGVLTTAHAARWESVYASPVGSISVDRSAFSKDGPLVSTALHIKLQTPDTLGSTLYDERFVTLTINCDTWQYTMTSESFSLHGKRVRDWQGGPTDDTDIDPDKPLEQAAKALCGKS